MTVNNNIYQLNQTQPTLASVLDSKAADIKSSICCVNPGTIVKFNPDLQVADVQLVQDRQYFGNYYSPPLLINLPVLLLGAPDNNTTYPKLEGANCIVLTCDRDISSFIRTGSIAPPSTNRFHNISDSIVLPFITTQNEPLKNYNTKAIQQYIKIKDEETGAEFTNTITNGVGGITLTTTQGAEESEGEEGETTSSQIDVTPSDIKINPNGLVNIANAEQSLLTIFTQLITACKNIVDSRGDTVNAASQQAFTDVQTMVEGLFN